MSRTIPLALLLAAAIPPALAQAPAPTSAPTPAPAWQPPPGPLGGCGFDRTTLSFSGTRTQQATCLLRHVKLMGAKEPQPLPPVIARLMADEGGPSTAQAAAALAAFPEPYRAFARAHAADPISRTEAGLPAQYFVIHDTSEPYLGDDRFPPHLDSDREVNDFTPYMDQTFGAAPVAHIFLARTGQIWAGHDFAEGWRATKLESRVVGSAARGRFVHIETMQPRRNLPGAVDRSQTQGPVPGFSAAQYRMLAALYVYASARAHRWLIPAQHSTVDDGIPDAHDDPQNFELKRFTDELEKLISTRQPGP